MTEKNKYARIVVGIPIENIFDYLVPNPFIDKLKIGMRVIVPFGKRRIVGYVVDFTDKTEVTDIKEIREILDEEPILSDSLLKLTRWMANYYFSTWGMAIKTALPSALNNIKPKTVKKKKQEIKDDLKGNRHPVTCPIPITLNKAQGIALRKLKEGLDDCTFKTFLLHGITGSGKTEVYMQAIDHLKEKGVIVLLPEISLTPNIIMRFYSMFGNDVAVLHSGLSESERIYEWRRIHKGEARIAIGVRSAIFAPVRRLGLIIVDEEQDPSYKQEDGLRYNARDLAIMRGKFEGATVILSSATPSLESFYNAQKGKYHYLHLPERFDQRPLPSFSLVDISKEKKMIISERLRQGISDRLKRGERVLLLLNRRGYSPFLLCRECGYAPKCPNCSIIMTYHKLIHKGKEVVGPILNCHYCNHRVSPPLKCPGCGGINIGYIGAGTERVEEEVKRLYPEVNLLRIDRDIINRKKRGYKEEKAIDIILGTKMIAKGDDFPSVTLAGIIWADGGLHIPDFRSGERTFQLISQLAARVGGKGEVIIQTHNPDNYTLWYAKENDYLGFYRKELRLRKELKYPPFYRLVRVLLKGNKEEALLRIIPDIKGIIKRLGSEIPEPDSRSGLEVLGPAPAPLYKLRGKFRWHLIIKGRSLPYLHDYTSRLIENIKEKRFPGVKIEIDMDPIKLV